MTRVAHTEPEGFTDEELALVFCPELVKHAMTTSDRHPHGMAERLYVPLISLLLATRTNEPAQLLLPDVAFHLLAA